MVQFVLTSIRTEEGLFSRGFSIFVLITLSIFLMVVCFLFMPSHLDELKHEREMTCITLLKEFAKAEAKYKAENLDFGDLDILVKNNLIDGDIKRQALKYYKIENIINNDASNGHLRSFTILAIPRSKLSNLRTFIIRQDSKVLLWKGMDSAFSKEKFFFSDPEMWAAVDNKRDLALTEIGEYRNP